MSAPGRLLRWEPRAEGHHGGGGVCKGVCLVSTPPKCERTSLLYRAQWLPPSTHGRPIINPSDCCSWLCSCRSPAHAGCWEPRARRVTGRSGLGPGARISVLDVFGCRRRPSVPLQICVSLARGCACGSSEAQPFQSPSGQMGLQETPPPAAAAATPPRASLLLRSQKTPPPGAAFRLGRQTMTSQKPE